MKTDYLWATGICSVHQQPNPLCGICNPQIARLQEEINRLKEQPQRGRGTQMLITIQKDRIKDLEAEVKRLRDTEKLIKDTEKLIKDTVAASMDAFWNTPAPKSFTNQ